MKSCLISKVYSEWEFPYFENKGPHSLSAHASTGAKKHARICKAQGQRMPTLLINNTQGQRMQYKVDMTMHFVQQRL